MEQRISLITLGVTDLARSRQFYEQGLGWHPSSARNEQVTFFQTGSMVLALYGKTALAQDAHLSHEGTGFGGRLLLDSRVVDVSMAYNPTFVILSFFKPLFFNGPDKNQAAIAPYVLSSS